MLSERDARLPRPEVASSSQGRSPPSRHMPSITRTTEREACPVEQHCGPGEGRVLRRRGHSASVTPTRTPARSHRSQLRSRSRGPFRGQFCGQQRTAPDANTAAGGGARSAAICAAQSQAFSDSGCSEKVDQEVKTSCILRRCIPCNATPEDGRANGRANGCASGCGKRAAVASESAARDAPQPAASMTTAMQRITSSANANATSNGAESLSADISALAVVLPLAVHPTPTG